MLASSSPCIFPIAGGKGGVGKSFVSASLGAFLAKLHQSVILVDLDLGAANLHTLLGLSPPVKGLHQFLNKSVLDLASVAVPTAIPNLQLISSCQCSMEVANLYHQQKIKIINAIRRLKADYVLLDLGAGTHFNTLDFFLSGEQGIVVMTPEPTAIENTIRFIRSVTIRKLKQLIKQHEFHVIVRDAVDQAQKGALNSPDVIERILRYDPDKKDLMLRCLGEFTFQLTINQFRKTNDARIGEKLRMVCSRHFYSRFDCLGLINYDDRVHDSILSRTLYVHKYPYTTAAVDLRNIAGELITRAINTPLSAEAVL
ncbi:MAG: P-loop NTPase [Pseudomonadota bacterium]